MIMVHYKCKCFDDEATVMVPARQEGEDIKHWLEKRCGEAIGNDHTRRSPNCRREFMEYVKIPAPEAAPFIGAQGQ